VAVNVYTTFGNKGYTRGSFDAFPYMLNALVDLD